MKRFKALLATAVAGTLATVALAQGPADRERGPGFDAIQEKLQLSDAQIQQLQESNQAMRQAVRGVLEGTRATRRQLREELAKQDPNPAVVGQLTLELRQVRDQMRAQREEFRAQALEVLTPDQQAALAEIEESLKLAPLARQAIFLNLLEAPERGEGPRAGFFGRRGPHAFRR